VDAKSATITGGHFSRRLTNTSSQAAGLFRVYEPSLDASQPAAEQVL